MKTQTIRNASLLALLTTFSSCEVIGGIFKTGMGVGIFITVVIIVIVIFIISRLFKGKK